MASLSTNSKKVLAFAANLTAGRARDFGWFIGEVLETLSDPYGKAGRGMAPKKIYATMTSLTNGGYIEKTKKRNHKLIRITDKGKLTVLQEVIIHKPTQQKWDHKWRMVIFDIPEDDRRERNFLRSCLKSFGLKELQKSVWVFPYDIEKEFNEFFKLCNKTFEGDIRFITVEKINKDSDLKSYFKLK